MSIRARFLVLAAVAVLLFAIRALEPVPPNATGAFGRGPTIVLVHGLGSRAEHWLPVARRLATRHRVVLVDLPGHGQSAMPAPLSLERAARALDLALAREGDRPLILVGHSIGGLVAAAEAIDHPERVRGLVLVETTLRPQASDADRTTLLAALDHDYRRTVRQAWSAFGRDSVQGARLAREVEQLDPAMIKSWIWLAVTTDLSTRIAMLDVPMLVVLSPRSWAPNESWDVAAKALGYEAVPHAQPLRIDGCGHFVMLDQPAALAAAIERFADAPAGSALAMK